MQVETDRHVLMSEFVKLKNEDCGTIDFVRLFRTSEFGYSITTGHNYKTDEMPNDWIDQEITCWFPATASWIFQHCKDICDAVNSGDIVTDIPLNIE